MELILAQEAVETTVRKVPFEVVDVPIATTHLLFRGDLSFVVEDLAKYTVIENKLVRADVEVSRETGNLMLAEGDGDKVVQVAPMVPSGFNLSGAVSSIVLGPPDTYRVLPAYQNLVSATMVGATIYKDTTTFSQIIGVEDVGGVLYYNTASDLGLVAGDSFWFNRDLYLGEFVPDAIKLVTVEPLVDPDPSADIDMSSFWANVRDFWVHLDYDDRQLVEAVWTALTHAWGNSMQRLYEIDAAQSLFDMLIYRRQSWATLDASYRTYQSTGSTNRTTPDRFFDKTRRPFVQAVRPGADASDVGNYLTVNGKAYLISEVISAEEVVLQGAKFDTATAITYHVGGQRNEDLDTTNQFSAWATREKAVLLDSELWADLGIQDLDRVRCVELPGGGRVRYWPGQFGGGEVKTGEPDRLYAAKPIFNHAHLGVDVRLGGQTYRVVDVDSAGFWIQLSGASLVPQVGIVFDFLQKDFSEFSGGVFVAGSAVFQDASGESPFDETDVGVRIVVQSGPNAGNYLVRTVESATSVTLDREALANESNVVYQIPADAIADLEEGRMRRMPFGRLVDCVTATVACDIRVVYRTYGGDRLAECDTLQEWTQAPRDIQFDVVEFPAYGEIFVGHKSIEELVLYKKSGATLEEGVDYNIDLDEGVLTLPGGSSVSTGDDLVAEVSFQPYFGEEGQDYFLDDHWLSFRDTPKVRLWAADAYFDHEDPYKQYGSLIDFFQENTQPYYLALMALWITYWMGPRVGFVERGLNILTALPFVFSDGVVTSLSLRRIGLADQWVVTILQDSGETIQYIVPQDLQPFVCVGERVERFDILAGFFIEFNAAGRLSGRSLFDANNNPFIKDHIGGKAWIKYGDNAGVYNITQLESPSHLVLDADFVDQDDVSYRIMVPAVRIIDRINHPGFLQDFTSGDALEKYYTENTTAAERAIAQQIMDRHVFLAQVQGQIFGPDVLPDLADVESFLRRIKSTYKDFILQISNRFDDEFEIIDGDESVPDFTLDLTSTFAWFSAILPSQTDPVDGAPLLHGYEGYNDGEVLFANTFKDATNSPFALDHVGHYLWIPGGWRFYKNGSVNPAINAKRLYMSGPTPIFAASDVGTEVEIPSLGILATITSVISPWEVELDTVFDSLTIGLEVRVGHEVNQGLYKIDGYLSADTVTILGGLVPGCGILYYILDPIHFLDEEMLAFYEEGYVDTYDAGLNWLQRISF